MLRRFLLWVLGDEVVRKERFCSERDALSDDISDLRKELVAKSVIREKKVLWAWNYSTLCGVEDETTEISLPVLRRDIDALYEHLGLEWEDVPSERRLVKRGKK